MTAEPATAAQETFAGYDLRQRGLDSIREHGPVIIIDTRETCPLSIRRLRSVRAGLRFGDYSIAGFEDRFAIERKSLEDLVACCKSAQRARLERELTALRGYEFARLLITASRADVAAHRYRSAMEPLAVFNSVAALEARYVPAVWAGTEAAGATLVEGWAWWYARECVERVNHLARGSVTERPVMMPWVDEGGAEDGGT